MARDIPTSPENLKRILEMFRQMAEQRKRREDQRFQDLLEEARRARGAGGRQGNRLRGTLIEEPGGGPDF